MDPKAYTQVSYIIENMSEELRKKIPQEFIDMIEKNKDEIYEIDVEDIDEIELLKDTEKMLSVIYTDYIASEEERELIRNKEKIINFQKEENKKKEYDVEIFKKDDRMSKEAIETKEEVAIIRKEKWYERIVRTIRKIGEKIKKWQRKKIMMK